MAYTTIKKPSDYFNTKLYTGNGSAGNAVTGVGFAPNMVWIKERSSTSSHTISDTVRGAGKRVNPNLSNAEETLTHLMTSFDSDGFTNGADNGVNESGQTYASWNWKANGAGSANTDGSINSTVSVNTTSGFSIVKYTGTGSNATVGHGLGVAPSMIIFKRLVGSGWNWTVYHKSMGNNYFMSLNLTNAKSNTSSSTYFQDTTPTSSVFSIGDSGHLNGSDVIAYCFADVQGFSKFGSYTGNGNANGSFIYTGFSPAFVMIKETTGTGKWVMKDNRRTGINVNQSTIYANEPEAEGTPGYELIDLLSNGFKQRGTGSYVNGSGGSYIYMAFAEQPLVGDNPATAR